MATIRISGQESEIFGFKPLLLDEFVPIVQIDVPVLKMDTIIYMNTNDGQVELSENIDASLRKIPLYALTLTPGTTTLPFYVKRGLKTSDEKGDISIKISGDAADTAFSPSDPISASFRQTFELNVNISGNAKRDFFINFYANDNADDLNVGEYKNIFCGRINLKTFPDTFSATETDQLIEEIMFIKPFADTGAPAEYAGNYCMSAAERGLSKLLNNQSDFYSVNRSHIRLNNISFAGKGAKNRAADFNASGFVFSSFEFNNYHVDHSLRKKTKNLTDYDTNKYSVVTLNPGSELLTYFKNSILGKNGYHIYYISVSDDFHALLLVVDSRNSGNESYRIYDQHGVTSSTGRLNDIEAGFARQTSWTFLNFYANHGFVPNFYGGVTTRIWKIQRKH